MKKPFIDLILSGKKRREIRPFRTHYRGDVLLLWKNRGWGVVEIYDVVPFKGGEISEEERQFLERYAGRTLYAWLLRNPRPLPEPVPVPVPRGAQTWVRLDPAIVARIRARLKNS